MANPAVLTADTVLYSPAEPDGRMYPQGSEWPGDAWSANRGGEPLGKGAAAQAAKDLVAAQDRLDAMSAQMDRQTHSMAEISAQRDEATGKLADTEQRAIAAEAAQAEAELSAHNYMVERDQARADAKRFSDLVDQYRPEAEKVADLTEQLTGANQAIADLTGKLADAQAEKPAKVKRVDTAVPADAAQPAEAA